MVKSNKPAAKKRQNFFACAAKKVIEMHKKILLMLTAAYITCIFNAATTMSAYASSTSGSSGTSTGTTDPDAMFDQIIVFFASWIGRIGLVVAFVGGVMFAFAIKNEDAEAKTRALMTLVSGFVVFAITKMLNLFGISVPII